MKKTLKIMIPVIIILAAILSIFLIYRHINRTIYNEEMIYGTSAGNFYNGGMFCEANGYIYFSNPYDKYRLYRMTPDGTEVTKLTEDSACYINADSHYLYYARFGSTADTSFEFGFLNFNTNSLCRIPVDGGNTRILDSAPTLYAILVQNNIYYIHYDTSSASTLYKVGIDGKNAVKITSEPLLLSPGQEGTLCYAGVSNNHNIALWNPQTDTGTELFQGTYYLPIDTENYIYYLDAADNYSLCRYDKASASVTKLVDARIDCYNLTTEYVYYQKNDGDNSALCRLRLDGATPEEVVMTGIFTNIHTASKYVYFSSFQYPEMVYQTPANDAIAVSNLSLQYSE